MIIGITGTNSAGKGTVVEILKEKGFKHYSARDVINKELKKRNLPLDRDHLIKMANELRLEFGSDYIAVELFKIAKSDVSHNSVIESLRTVGEVNKLKENSDFVLLAVDAKQKLRYERAVKRASETDDVSFEKFKDQEEKELSSDDVNKQNLLACIDLADYKLINNSTIDNLRKEVWELLKKMDSKNKVSKEERPGWDRYFMKIAEDIAARGTCLSMLGGAIIVKNKRILSTGYIGAPRNTKDCLQIGTCLRRELSIPSGTHYEICRSVHAEQNAIINAARDGVAVEGADMYLWMKRIYGGEKLINAIPCYICKKILINSGIKNFYGICEDGSIDKYSVDEWARELNHKELIDTNKKYFTDYKKK